MSKDTTCQEKFRTTIGGQALIEGIMMRGPEKDAVVVRTSEGMIVEVKQRKPPKEGSVLKWPLIRGAYGFFDAQLTGVKALMYSADFIQEDDKEETGGFEAWLEKKIGNERFQSFVIGFSVVLGLGFSILLFFLLPMLIGSIFYRWIQSNLAINLIEGIFRMIIFVSYMCLVSRMKEMRRVFSYHGAEHKTIRCYEAGLPLTIENVKKQTRRHPRCGTSFLLVVMIISILVFSVASSLLLNIVPGLREIQGSVVYRAVMIMFKLLLLPAVVAVSYEINRWAGRHDNVFTKILTAPGMWFQSFTTNEPDDSMIEVGIEALRAVIPEEKGTDKW